MENSCLPVARPANYIELVATILTSVVALTIIYPKPIRVEPNLRCKRKTGVEKISVTVSTNLELTPPKSIFPSLHVVAPLVEIAQSLDSLELLEKPFNCFRLRVIEDAPGLVAQRSKWCPNPKRD